MTLNFSGVILGGGRGRGAKKERVLKEMRERECDERGTWDAFYDSRNKRGILQCRSSRGYAQGTNSHRGNQWREVT